MDVVGESLRPNLGASVQAGAVIAAIDLSAYGVKCQNHMVISVNALFALLVKGCVQHL